MIHGYIRVSTERQAGEDRSSLEDQERRIHAATTIRQEPGCEPEPITIWSDPGVSGNTPLANRPSGGRMVAALQPGDVIIAAKLDRLFRNAEDALAQSRTLRERNVDLILVDMGTESVTSSLTGRLYFTMLAAFAEFERGRIAERIQDGRKAKRDCGGYTGGNPPTGYKIVGSGRAAILESNPTELEAISCAHHLKSQGETSPTKIANLLNAQGYRSRNGSNLTATQVWRWLKNASQ